MLLDGKQYKEIIGKRVCAKNVTTLFLRFSNSRRNWVHSHKATNIATPGNT